MSLAGFPCCETGIMQDGLLDGACFVAFAWQKKQNGFLFSGLKHQFSGFAWIGSPFQA